MDMRGEFETPAPRETVWAALNDPEVLKASIPGCQSLEKSGDNGFEAKVRAKVGPVSATFQGQVELTDIDPPNGYRIVGEGKGGAAGFARGQATVRLEETADGGTRLTYVVDAAVGGKLAQIGSRLIDATAKKMADEFFGKFQEQVGNSGSEQIPVAAEAAPSKPVEVTTPPAPEGVRESAQGSRLLAASLAGLAVLALAAGLVAYL